MKRFIYSLLILLLTAYHSSGQQIKYGSNLEAGKYVETNGANIYYEVYGEGEPLILLHGDFYGYIDEYSDHIPVLAESFKVIAIAKRGHGKSELGNVAFTEDLFAQDVLAVANQESATTFSLLSFSAGSTTAYYLAAHHPNRVEKIVTLAGGIGLKSYKPEAVERMKQESYASLQANMAGFLKMKKKLMPEPERLGELYDHLKPLWLAETAVEELKVKAIRSPVLMFIGEEDDYRSVAGVREIQEMIPNSELVVVENCSHVGLVRKSELVSTHILPFLLEQN